MRLLTWHHSPGYFWFRLCGWGLLIKDRRYPPLFSERTGRRRFITILGWKIRFLSPNGY